MIFHVRIHLKHQALFSSKDKKFNLALLGLRHVHYLNNSTNGYIISYLSNTFVFQLGKRQSLLKNLFFFFLCISVTKNLRLS